MPKLIENVLSRKERAKQEKLKELEQRRIAKALRHQLAHQNVLSNMGAWLTKRLTKFTKNVKIKSERTQEVEDHVSDTTDEERRTREPIVIPLFNLKKYANDRNSKFQKLDIDRAWAFDQVINKKLRKM